MTNKTVNKAAVIEAIAAAVRDSAMAIGHEAGNLSEVCSDLGPSKSARYGAAMTLVFAHVKFARADLKTALSQLRKSVYRAQKLRGDDLKGVVSEDEA